MLKMKKRNLSLILTLLLVLAFAVSAQAAPAKNTAGYYEITTADDMVWFQEQVAAGNTSINAMLTADIDLSGVVWKPIWSSNAYEANPVLLDITGNRDAATPMDNYAYQGTFDGQGHTITIKMDDASLVEALYAETITTGAAGDAPTDRDVPTLGGGLFFAVGKDAVVKGFTLTGEIIIKNTPADNNRELVLGGVAAFGKGVFYDIHLKDMKVHNVSVKAHDSEVGGIVGVLHGANTAAESNACIDSCSAINLDMYNADIAIAKMGLIVSNAKYHAVVKNTTVTNSKGILMNVGHAGGIAAYAGSGTSIVNCHTSGLTLSTEAGAVWDNPDVNTRGFSMGGIVATSLMRDYALVNVTYQEYAFLVENCTVTDLTIIADPDYSDSSITPVLYLGGIAGRIEGNVDAAGEVQVPIIRNNKVSDVEIESIARNTSASGGIVGIVIGPGVVEGNIAEGATITADQADDTEIGSSGTITVGGILGGTEVQQITEGNLQITDNIVRDLDVSSNLSNDNSGNNNTTLRAGGVAGSLGNPILAANATDPEVILLENNGVEGDNTIAVENNRSEMPLNTVQIGGLTGFMSNGTARENSVGDIDYTEPADPVTSQVGNLVGRVFSNNAASAPNLEDNMFAEECITGDPTDGPLIGSAVIAPGGGAAPTTSGNVSFDASDLSLVDTEFVILAGLTDPITLEPGQTIIVSPQGFAGTKQFDVMLLSSDPNVLSVVDNGDGTYTVTAVGEGSASIQGYYTTKDGNQKLDIPVTIAEKGVYTGDTVVPVTEGGDPNDIYQDEEVNITYDFGDYIPVAIDNTGMLGSGLEAEIVDGKVVLSGTAENPGEYYYVVTLERPDGTRFDQKMPVTIQSGSRPAASSYGGGGSSNCNAGMGFWALVGLLGLAWTQKRK